MITTQVCKITCEVLPGEHVVVDQREPQAAGSLQRSQVQLVPEDEEVQRQGGLAQQEDAVRAQPQL